MDSAFAPYQLMYPARFRLLSPTTLTVSAEDGPVADDIIRNLLLKTHSVRLQDVLHRLQTNLSHIDNATTITLTTPATPSSSKDASENCDKIAVMLYSFSEVHCRPEPTHAHAFALRHCICSDEEGVSDE